MVAGSSLWMRRQAGLPRTWRPVRPEAARGVVGAGTGSDTSGSSFPGMEKASQSPGATRGAHGPHSSSCRRRQD